MDDIYKRQELLEIYKDPANRGTIDSANVVVQATNPMCGDEITLYLVVNEKNIIEDVKFDGDACAVSIISSSLVTEELVGRSLSEAKNLTKKDVLELIDVGLTTSRIKCATLILDAIYKAVAEWESERKTK